jgi:hypothetical protein
MLMAPVLYTAMNQKNENKNLNIRDTEQFNTNHCFFVQFMLFLWIIFNIYFNSINMCTTKCSLVVNTAGSYLGGPEFKSQEHKPAIMVQVVSVLSPYKQMLDSSSKIRSWLPPTTPFPSHYSLAIECVTE